jgi:hypothetical protein
VVTAVDGIAVKSVALLRNAIGLVPGGWEVELTRERKGSPAGARVQIAPSEGSGWADGAAVRPASGCSVLRTASAAPHASAAVKPVTREHDVARRAFQSEEATPDALVPAPSSGRFQFRYGNMASGGTVRLVPNEHLTRDIADQVPTVTVGTAIELMSFLHGSCSSYYQSRLGNSA